MNAVANRVNVMHRDKINTGKPLFRPVQYCTSVHRIPALVCHLQEISVLLCKFSFQVNF